MKKLIYKYAGLLAGVWTLIIFVLCATPGQYIPSANWLELLSFDKWVHAGMFFVLTSLGLLSVAKNGGASWMKLLIALGAVAYGGLLEIMQAVFFSRRSADWLDFIADSAGCLLAVLLFSKIRSSFEEKSRPPVT